MAFRDDLLAILTGGLPALGGGASIPIVPVEEVPPEPQLQDMEPFLIPGVSMQQVFVGGALLLGILGVILIARRL